MKSWDTRRKTPILITAIMGTAVLVAIFLAFPLGRVHGEISATNGIIDLTPTTRESVVSIQGSWQVVFDRLLTPAAFGFIPYELVEVPGSFPDTSRLTYRISLRGLKPYEDYALQFMGVATTAEVFVNGRSVGTVGRSGRDGTVYPTFVPTLFLDLPHAKEVTVVVQVQNDLHYRGGLWHDVHFGPRDTLLRYRDRLVLVDALLVGALLLVGVYHLILAALHSGDTSIGLFAVLTLLIAVISSLTGQHILLYHLNPVRELPWIRGAYVAVTLSVPILLKYTRRLFSNETTRGVQRVTGILAILQVLLVLVLPYAALQREFAAWYVVTVLVFGYAMTIILNAIRTGETGSRASLFGFLFLFLFVVNDILFDLQVVHTGYVLSVGIFGFILSQTTVIALRYEGVFQELSQLRTRLEETVMQRTRELQEERNALRRLARHDELTGLYNRRYGGELLTGEIARFLRYGTSLAVLLVDLDHFKNINDNRGHQVGDDTLREFSRILKETTRATDMVCRWGGEEFLLILPSTGGGEAQNLATKLQETLAVMPLETREGPITVTFSGGVSCLDPAARPVTIQNHSPGYIMDQLLRAADLALYSAKRAGRNTIRRQPLEDPV